MAEYFGGDSGNVTDRLHGVAEIAASSGAFAAILQGSGRVVAWGAVDSGGDTTKVQQELVDVQQIQVHVEGLFNPPLPAPLPPPEEMDLW